MTNSRILEVERTTSTAHRLLHYEGACGNVHGHNMRWEVEVGVAMEKDDESNMPLDLKDISETIDTFDHALVLNANDPLTQYADVLGDVIEVEDGDPTCERMVEVVGDMLVELDCVEWVDVTCSETDKYSIRGTFYDGQPFHE